MSDSEDAVGGEEALVSARRAKAERVRSRGETPFANDVGEERVFVQALRMEFAPALIDAVELRYDPDMVAALAGTRSVRVFGRIISRRGFGKAAFLKLRDASGELQLFARKDVLGADFDRLDDVDVGDHIAAAGGLMVTKTGELSVQVTSLRLLTKALRPLPDKWHGLTDVDVRYRRRYVDLVANPDAAAVLRSRSIIVQALRRFLDSRGFLEVETPTLHQLVGGAAARPFTTHHNALDLPLFLRIAPELYLKRLLVGGLERVYEIGRCYRNEGISTRHNPEFTMLEYYQAYATYDVLMTQTEDMLRWVDEHLARALSELGLAKTYESFVAARPFALREPFVRLPMAESIARAVEAAGLPADLPRRWPEIAVTHGADGKPEHNPDGDALVQRLAGGTERSRAIDWRNLRRALGGCANDGERTFVAYEYLVEPTLAQDFRTADGKSIPVFIVDYPFEVSPLARRKDRDPTLTDRFELFVHGRELCNAFSELNDPDDQAARFRDQVEKKARGADETMDYDADYVRALEHGMPPAAGFGLGVDRLVMMLASQPSIRDVIAFPLLRPESA